MKYLFLTLFFTSFSAFSLEQNDIENKLPLVCSNSNYQTELVLRRIMTYLKIELQIVTSIALMTQKM